MKKCSSFFCCQFYGDWMRRENLYWEFCGIFIWNFREFSVIFSHHSPKNPDWKMFEGKLSSISINKQCLLYFIALWKIPVENIPKISDKIKNFTNFLWLGDVGKLWIKKSLEFPTQKKIKLNFLAKNNTRFSHFPVSRTKIIFGKFAGEFYDLIQMENYFKLILIFNFAFIFLNFWDKIVVSFPPHFYRRFEQMIQLTLIFAILGFWFFLYFFRWAFNLIWIE